MKEAANIARTGLVFGLLNPSSFNRKLTDADGSRLGGVLPENAALVTPIAPLVPHGAMVPVLHLKLDTDFMVRELRRLIPDGVDFSWPGHPGRSSVSASQTMFDRVWDLPGEDEAWRDL